MGQRGSRETGEPDQPATCSAPPMNFLCCAREGLCEGPGDGRAIERTDTRTDGYRSIIILRCATGGSVGISLSNFLFGNTWVAVWGIAKRERPQNWERVYRRRVARRTRYIVHYTDIRPRESLANRRDARARPSFHHRRDSSPLPGGMADSRSVHRAGNEVTLREP